MQELIAKRNELVDAMHRELENMRNSGIQLAQNEAEYRRALSVEILMERSNGTPVTVISDICRGKEHIAELRQARDCAEAVYKASQEAVNVYKLEYRTLDNEIQRIWNSGGYQ